MAGRAAIACCRCGGPTSIDGFGNGVCRAGKSKRICGHWWRRDGGCDWSWSSPEGKKPCPGGCRWDHKLFWMPTYTTPAGQEHRYHAPGHMAHTVLAVVRPKGGRRLAEIPLGPPVDERRAWSDDRLYRMRGAA